jgi:hypothetical protein
MKLSDIRPNPNNPRIIRDERFAKLKNSIEQFPKMMHLRPIVVDSAGVILGGNMRLRALQDLGFKEIPDEWVKRADDLTEEEKQRFIIADNVGFGEWEWETLANEWHAGDLEAWGLDVPVFGEDEDNAASDKTVEAHQKLQEIFTVPPFSVLDTRQGYWQERKRHWRELIQDKGESREDTLAKGAILAGINNGVSLLDPVLAELACRWFGLPACATFDPFAGDSVFGYVSAYLGNKFTGIELRQEQANLNNDRVKGFPARYVCDDGRNIRDHIGEETQDLLFSCPPYFDLEVYSDLPNDASNQKEYSDFIKILDDAFAAAIKCLRPDRFAVIVVGDVRDSKTGFYRRFVDDVKDIFKGNGCLLYNELILVENLGTLPQRVGRTMEHRKIGKCHQNVLVFFKGNPKNIKGIFPKIEIPEQEDESTDV